MREKLLELFYHIRDDKSSDLFKGLEEILVSRDSLCCYNCASMCMEDKRIPSEKRPEYAIRFARVVFESLDYELIERFLKKVDRKPAYQEFIKSEFVVVCRKQAYQKYLEEVELQEQRDEQARQREIDFLNSIPYVEKITEAQEYSRLVYSAKSLEEKSIIVLASNVPYFSYKYVKEVLKTTGIPQEAKKALVMPHAEFVFTSGDEVVIKKLADFLQYKPLYKEYVDKKQKARKRVPQE